MLKLLAMVNRWLECLRRRPADHSESLRSQSSRHCCLRCRRPSTHTKTITTIMSHTMEL